MTARPFAALLLACAALALAACGDDEQPAAAQASDEQQLRAAQVKFAQCMREHGVDVPDPGNGGELRTQARLPREELEAAEKACERYRKEIRPQLSEEQQAEFKQQALAHSRCMREHGIDLPDPQFTAEGGAKIELHGRAFDPDDPDFKAAEKACGGGPGGPGSTTRSVEP